METTGTELAGRNILGGYYLASVAFLVLDLVAGWNVRVSALNGAPAFKYLYYTGCFGCGIFIFKRPRSAPLVTLLESSLNLALLLVGLVLAYWGSFDAILDPEAPQVFLTSGQVLNVTLSGSALVGGIYTNSLLRLPGGMRPPGPVTGS
jgi:hypothetical protein